MLEAMVLILAMAGEASDTRVYEADGVRVEAAVTAQIYTWTVTNVDAEPIMSFSVPQHNTYNQNFPAGWEMRMDDGVFHAWTYEQRLAIRPGQSATFDARSGSAGSMLGGVPVTLGFSADSQDVQIAQVWGPVPKKRGIVVLVAGTLIAIGLLHVAMLRRLERRPNV